MASPLRALKARASVMRTPGWMLLSFVPLVQAASLHEAAERGDVADIKAAIRLLGRAALQERDEDGYTPLHIAAWLDDLDMVKYLAGEAHADMNQATTSGGLKSWLKWLALHEPHCLKEAQLAVKAGAVSADIETITFRIRDQVLDRLILIFQTFDLIRLVITDW